MRGCNSKSALKQSQSTKRFKPKWPDFCPQPEEFTSFVKICPSYKSNIKSYAWQMGAVGRSGDWGFGRRWSDDIGHHAAMCNVISYWLPTCQVGIFYNISKIHKNCIFNPFSRGTHPYIKAVHRMTAIIMLRMFKPRLIPEFLFRHSKEGKEFKKSADIVHQHAEQVVSGSYVVYQKTHFLLVELWCIKIIAERRRVLENRQIGDNLNVPNEESECGERTQLDFLDILLQTRVSFKRCLIKVCGWYISCSYNTQQYNTVCEFAVVWMINRKQEYCTKIHLVTIVCLAVIKTAQTKVESIKIENNIY